MLGFYEVKNKVVYIIKLNVKMLFKILLTEWWNHSTNWIAQQHLKYNGKYLSKYYKIK